MLWAAVAVTAASLADGGLMLEGIVRELGTRDPIAAAALQSNDVLVETDGEGRFTLPLPPGESQVHVTASGYLPRDFVETADAGTRLSVIYRLEPAGVVYRTTISGQKYRTEAARVALSREELTESAGSAGEPLRTLMRLPGIASVASGLAYPVVRGTQPAATAYFIDSVRVPQLFHALVGLSVLHPDFIDKLSFYPGLPPVQYGRLLGGAVDATVARPLDGRVHATASLDLVNASAFVEVPIERTRTSVSAAGRISYTPLIGTRIASAVLSATGGADRTPVANFWDYQVRAEQAVGPLKVRALVFGSSDQVGTTSLRADSPSALLDAQFHRADALASIGGDGVSLELGMTAGTDFTSVHGELGERTVFGLSMARTLWGARAAFAYVGQALTVRAGADAEYQHATSSAVGEVTRVPSQSFLLDRPDADALLGSAWLSLHLELDGLETTAGVRAELYQLFPSTVWVAVDPRLEERLRVNDTLAVRAGAGMFHQAPTALITLPASEVSTLDQGLQWAAHFEVGADVKLPLGAELGLTAFYQPIFRSVEYRLDELVDPRRELGKRSPATEGRAYGAELFVRRTKGRFFGWLSATLQHSERRAAVVRYDDGAHVAEGPFAADVPFAFDQLFVLDATFGVRLPRGFSVGLSFHFNTGRPESGDISSRNQREAVDPASGYRWWVPQDADRVARLPPYARLDVRVAKLWTLDDLTLELYLDVFNASAGREVLGYTYRVSNPGPSGTPERDAFSIPIILPMLGVKGRY